MKQLIIVRNASLMHDGSNHMSSDGVEEMFRLASEIKVLGRSNSIFILSSIIKYAHESAWALSDELQRARELYIQVETDPIFSQHGYFEKDIEDAWQTILKYQLYADTIIVVTHIEFTETLPSKFFREWFNVSRKFKPLEIGSAYCIEGRNVRIMNQKRVPRL